MRVSLRVRTGLALLVFVFGPAMALRAQLSSNPAAVNLQAVLAQSLTVSASPGLVNFALVPSGVANGSSPVAITTSWVLPPGIGSVSCYAYFTSAPAALTNGAGRTIPSSRVLGSVNGGAFAAFTANSPFAVGSSLLVFRERIRRINRTRTRTDSLNLRIDTTGLALPAGTYTGLLRIRARAL